MTQNSGNPGRVRFRGASLLFLRFTSTSFTGQQAVLLLAISRAAWPELREAQKQDSVQEVIDITC